MLKIVYHEGYLTPYYTSKVESPVRIKAIHNRLKGHYETVMPKAACREDILRAHDPQLLNCVQAKGREVYGTALLSAGGALCAAHLACEGAPSFAIIRPPGHHAGRNRCTGFCFFNNMAVAMQSLLHSGRIRSAVVVDFDMHQGDGTQEIFSNDPRVSIIDIWSRERGSYLKLLLDAISRMPATDIIGVCAGFDLYVKDWGGLLETSDFYEIGRAIHRAAAQKSGGRCFALLEGGYYLNELGRNALALCQGLEGRSELSL